MRSIHPLMLALTLAACGSGATTSSDAGTLLDAAACGADETQCAGGCTNLKLDPANCGACGNGCAAGEVCAAGTCALSCPPGLSDCKGACRDLAADGANCGACGNVCAPGQLCGSGACAQTCSTGQDACPATSPTYCATLASDTNNCGACGATCPAGQTCAGSTCACPATRPDACGSGASAFCTDFATDPLNCGDCGKSCAAGQLCAAGACVQTCSTGQTACPTANPTYCATLPSDANNCGACGHACPAGRACVGSACQCGDAAVCVAGACGNGVIESGEACDDGNLAGNDGCSATCTQEAGFSCSSDGFGTSRCVPICGDGLVVGNEACDDRNISACGNCNATCTQAQPAIEARGSITTIAGNSLRDGETVTISDGIIVLVFEFDVSATGTFNGVAPGHVAVAVNSGGGAGVDSASIVAARLATSINGGGFRIFASPSGSIIALNNGKAGSAGNVAITSTVANARFIVGGMTGGGALDCAPGVGCVGGSDCASILCDPVTHTCRVPTCTDAVENGYETDVDCGGGSCAPCGNGLGCLIGADCASGVCASGVCSG